MRQHKIILRYNRFIQLLFTWIASFILYMSRWTRWFMVLYPTNDAEISWLNLSAVIFGINLLFWWVCISCINFILWGFNFFSFLVLAIFIFGKWQWSSPSLKRKIVEFRWINSFDRYFLCVSVGAFDIFFLVEDDCLVCRSNLVDCLFTGVGSNNRWNLSFYELILLWNNRWRWRNMSLFDYQFLFTFLSFFNIFHNA